jgi:hypothetical protein
MTTTSHKLSSSSLKGKASVLSLSLMMVASVLFAAAPSAMAQQTTTTTATVTTPPLTPEEQQQQNRLQNTIAAISRNLEQGQKEVNGLVYTPRWSSPVWVEPDSLSILFVYCLPGEFADSGQHILGGSELEVLESYSLAVTNDLSGWLIVVENENENARLPAAVGVICSSDANDLEARILSQQEQIEINNIIRQFITVRNTVINNVTQIINIINNVTTNGTAGPTPPPPPTNDTGTNDTGGPTLPPTNVTGGPPPSLLEPGVAPPTNVTAGPTLPPATEGGGAEPPATEGGAEPPATEGGGAEPPATEGGGAEPPATIDTLGQ